MRSSLAAVVSTLALLGCGTSAPAPSVVASPAQPAAGGPPRVLFVGNSLTEVNGLPAMVEALARAAGQPLSAEAVVMGGFSLEDHWNQGGARQVIARGGWRYVVLQQGPSALPESRSNLVEWAQRFATEIRRAGARPALYAVWPEAARASVFDDVSESYRVAAERVDGALFPAGEAWRAAWRREASLELYGPDGFHPSVRGTYLAALVICAQVLDRSPVGLARGLTRAGGGAPDFMLSPAEGALLQDAADEAIRLHGRR